MDAFDLIFKESGVLLPVIDKIKRNPYISCMKPIRFRYLTHNHLEKINNLSGVDVSNIQLYRLPPNFVMTSTFCLENNTMDPRMSGYDKDFAEKKQQFDDFYQSIETTEDTPTDEEDAIDIDDNEEDDNEFEGKRDGNDKEEVDFSPDVDITLPSYTNHVAVNADTIMLHKQQQQQNNNNNNNNSFTLSIDAQTVLEPGQNPTQLQQLSQSTAPKPQDPRIALIHQWNRELQQKNNISSRTYLPSSLAPNNINNSPESAQQDLLSYLPRHLSANNNNNTVKPHLFSNNSFSHISASLSPTNIQQSQLLSHAPDNNNNNNITSQNVNQQQNKNNNHENEQDTNMAEDSYDDYDDDYWQSVAKIGY